MGYISVEIRRRVREQANDRCGYCQLSQQMIPYPLEIEHLIPVSRGGTDDEDNLWLACSSCNRRKNDRLIAIDPETEENTPLFNPRTQNWDEHFEWIEDGLKLKGLTAIGRSTIQALQLNNDPLMLDVRQRWMNVGWHPPD